MRVLLSRGERAPIKSSMIMGSHHSKMDSIDAEGICDENPFADFLNQIEKMQQQNVQFNDTVGSADADLFANLDKEDNELLRKFVTEMDVTLPVLSYADPVLGNPKNTSPDAGLFQVPNTVRQPEMDFNRMTGDYARRNSEQTPWSGYEMGSTQQNVSELQLLNNQAEQQRLMILDLQKQLHNFTVIQQQQYRQKLLEKEKLEMQMQAQIAQEAAVKEARSIRMRSKNAEAEIVSPNNPPVCVPNQLNTIYGLESMQAHSRQCTQTRTVARSNDKDVVDAQQTYQSKKLSRHAGQTNRVDKSEGSLRNKKQVRANIRVKRSDVAGEKDPVVREKSATFSCGECGRAFNQKSSLTDHLRIHSGEKPFKCTDCGTSFSTKGNLTVHKRIHTGAKPFKCGECGTSFSQKSNLTVHKRIHSGVKPFKCTDCGTSFCRKSHLTDHKRIHTGAKPYECRICNAAFSRKNSLSRHLLIHTNEKPFICDICNTEFRLKSTLSDHMNIHSGNRPHKCNVCQKTFRQRSNLSSHRKVHAQEEE